MDRDCGCDEFYKPRIAALEAEVERLKAKSDAAWLEAETALGARDAEIGRLREALTALRAAVAASTSSLSAAFEAATDAYYSSPPAPKPEPDL